MLLLRQQYMCCSTIAWSKHNERFHRFRTYIRILTYWVNTHTHADIHICSFIHFSFLNTSFLPWFESFLDHISASTSSYVTHTCSHYVIVLEWISISYGSNRNSGVINNNNNNNNKNNDDGNRISTWKSKRARMPLHVHPFSHTHTHTNAWFSCARMCTCKRFCFTLRQEVRSFSFSIKLLLNST